MTSSRAELGSTRGSAKRVALFGGGSAFVPALAEALLDRAAEPPATAALPPLVVRLFGRDVARTQLVARFCDARADHRGLAVRFVAARTIAELLEGADVVVNQVRVGGFAARSHDETFPLRFGIPGDETIGPGGLANALRTVPVVADLAHAVERHAPTAWFVQLSNPMGIVVAALARATRLRVFGLCELPQRTLDEAARLLGVAGPLESDYVGVNHQGFFTSLRAGGRELLPELARALAGRAGGGWFRIDGRWIADHHALPLRYLRLILFRERTLAAARATAGDRGGELAAIARELFAAYATSDGSTLPPALAQREMPWHALAIAPALLALLADRPAELYVSAPNAGRSAGAGTGPALGAVDFLPADAVVERRMRVDAHGITPLTRPPSEPAIRPLDAEVKALLQQIAAFERLAVDAACSGGRDAARAALLAMPFAIALMQPGQSVQPAQLDALLDEVLALPDGTTAAPRDRVRAMSAGGGA